MLGNWMKEKGEELTGKEGEGVGRERDSRSVKKADGVSEKLTVGVKCWAGRGYV